MIETVLFITTYFVLETFTSFVLAIIAVDMCLPTSRLTSISVVDAPCYCNNGVSGVKEEHGKKAKMDRKRIPNDVIWFIFSCSHSAWRILVWSFCGGVHFGISVNGNSKLCISFFHSATPYVVEHENFTYTISLSFSLSYAWWRHVCYQRYRIRLFWLWMKPSND